jgi:hypothetical protein
LRELARDEALVRTASRRIPADPRDRLLGHDRSSPGVPVPMPASFAGAKIELQDAAGALLARFKAVR